MPHFHIDYSANLDAIIDMGALCEVLRAEASQIDTFPMPGIRVRATRVDFYAIADGNPSHGFIDLSIRLREGREHSVKREAVERIFAVMQRYLEPVMLSQAIALSAEIRDIDASLSPKAGNIRQYLGDTA